MGGAAPPGRRVYSYCPVGSLFPLFRPLLVFVFQFFRRFSLLAFLRFRRFRPGGFLYSCCVLTGATGRLIGGVGGECVEAGRLDAG